MSEAANTLYDLRKLAVDVCLRCGKALAADAERQLCPRHLKKQRAADRKQKQRRRQKLRADGKCAFCKQKSKTYRCPRCQVRILPEVASVRSGVDRYDAKLARLRARTVKGDDGRTRYHGQERRGRQSIAALDEQDIDLAISELLRAKDQLAWCRSPKQMELPRIQRRDAELEALSHVQMALKICDETLTRNRVERIAVDDDDEDEGEDEGEGGDDV